MPVPTDESVTYWLNAAREREPDAVVQLWDRYFDRMVRLARSKMLNQQRRVADEEDVAISAFHSFCRRAASDDFPELNNRDNLWRILAMITSRKAIDQHHHDRRLVRGGGRTRGESAFQHGDVSESSPGLEQVPGSTPTPDSNASVAEELNRLIDRLDDPVMRSIAVWKMEGFTNAEIADKLGCVERTVERKLRMIRKIWDQEATDDG